MDSLGKDDKISEWYVGEPEWVTIERSPKEADSDIWHNEYGYGKIIGKTDSNNYKAKFGDRIFIFDKDAFEKGYLKKLDESIKESVTVYTSDEHASDDNDKHYYGYITIEHPTLGDFCVSCKITGKTEIRTDGYPWRFLQKPKYKLTGSQIEYVKAHEDELKKIARSGKPVSQLEESLQKPVNTKINIRESLNKIDWDTNNQYDLRNIYDACILSNDQKKEIAKMLVENASPEKLYTKLMEHFK